MTLRHAIGGAGWFILSLLIAFAPFAGVALLWWSGLDYLPSWTFLFGNGQLLLIVLAVAAAGTVDAVRIGFSRSLPPYVRVAAAICFAVLLLDLILAAMWYGSLQTPSKAHPDQLNYNPAHVVSGSILFFVFAAPTALLIAALREGISRR